MRDVAEAVAMRQHAQQHSVRAEHQGALWPSPAPMQAHSGLPERLRIVLRRPKNALYGISHALEPESDAVVHATPVQLQ